MPIIKKIRIGREATEIDRIVRVLRKEIAIRSLRYMNPMVARGIVADEISSRINEMFRKISLTRKMEKLGKSRLGRSYINNVVLNAVKKYGTEKAKVYGEETTTNAKVKIVRQELKKLYKNTNTKGIDYIQEVRGIIYSNFDRDTARKIDRELMIRINMLELGKKGLVDFVDGRTFFKTKEKPISFRRYSLKELHKAMDIAGVKKTKRDYFELKVGRLMVEAIKSSKSPEEAMLKFEQLYNKERENDPLFRQAEYVSALKFLTSMYNKAALMNLTEKTLTTIPNKLIKIYSRMLAAAYRMVPIVGAIAATQVEAAEAVTELGETISQKVESSAYMHYSLRDVLGDSLPISEIILEETRRNQINA